MEKRIQMILKELYSIDPGLRDKEEDLKKAIGELLSSKPHVVINKKFEKDLKRELLAKFSGRENKKRFFLLSLWRSGAFRAASAALAFCVIIAITMFYVRPGHKEIQLKTGLAEESRENLTKESTHQTQNHPAVYYGNNKVDETKQPENRAEYKPSQNKNIPAEPVTMDKSVVAGKRSVDDSKGPMKDTELSFAPVSSERETPAGVEKKKEIPALKAYNQLRMKQDFNTEAYDNIVENDFQEAVKEPLSTLSIDVDTASYANVRRFLNEGQLPYPDAVRIEELVNYFSYDYAEPKNDDPMAFNTEYSVCPWNKKHMLLRVGLQARKVDVKNLPPNNLVFLIDVSGSMEDENKLPLVKASLKMLVQQMRSIDRIAIVVYAGNAGLVLTPTSGGDKKKILAAIDGLEAGGSTAGGEGILLAYETAKKYYNANGNNRVILATDGDFNVGPSSDGELVRMIEEKRDEGIFLTVLGFGMGNYKDSKMVKLADKGNGNYAYIDTLSEAKKVLVNQMGGTLLTIAKDVKIQIEFNPAVVGQYRMIGYEKRVLNARDFDDDKKDAGELGAGHSVTVLYEIIPAEKETGTNGLRYQTTVINESAAAKDELMTIKFRYKKPKEDTSRLLVYPVKNVPLELNKTTGDYRFAASVAEWGQILRNSKYKEKSSFDNVIELASQSTGQDTEGYRREFIQLVKLSEELNKNK